MAYFSKSGTNRERGNLKCAGYAVHCCQDPPTTSSHRAHADVFECIRINLDKARVVCHSNGEPPAAVLRKFCVLHTSLLYAVTALSARRSQTCALREGRTHSFAIQLTRDIDNFTSD